jgi:hypothetical protein
MRRSGETVYVGAAASVQFAGERALYLRITKVHDDWHTYDGWAWISGYVLDQRGQAIEQRTLYVRHEGLRLVQPAPRAAPVRGNRGRY